MHPSRGCAGSYEVARLGPRGRSRPLEDRKSTRLNSSHSQISYAVFCLKKKHITHTRSSLSACSRIVSTCLPAPSRSNECIALRCSYGLQPACISRSSWLSLHYLTVTTT